MWGLGLGLDHANRVTIVKPGEPAAACGLIKVGALTLTLTLTPEP
jgi:hypothetical protein